MLMNPCINVVVFANKAVFNLLSDKAADEEGGGWVVRIPGMPRFEGTDDDKGGALHDVLVANKIIDAGRLWLTLRSETADTQVYDIDEREYIKH